MAIQAGRVGVRADQVDAYGRVNDTSFFNKIIDKLITWVDLPVWKGGTEQLLPENDDEPETSPILCDIDYPDQEREDQYFTYRESPTGSDGIAKIESIRGNTLVWNQIHPVVTSNANQADVTFTHTNDYTITLSGTASAGTSKKTVDGTNPFSIKSGHKYLFYGSKGKEGIVFRFYQNDWNDALPDVYSLEGGIATATITSNKAYLVLQIAIGTNTDGTVVVPQVFDLTQMFGAGNEPTTVAQFRSLFPLPYYTYNTGSLLNFTADKIKTVGFNQWDEEITHGYFSPVGLWVSSDEHVASKNPIPVFPNTTYYCALVNGTTPIYLTQWTKPVPSGVSASDDSFIRRNELTIENSTFVTDPNCHAIHINCGSAYGSTYKNNICINISDATKNGTYEPYTTNILELPISDFFPTGMKSAGEVYDELLPRRATTNIGDVDLGSLTWIYSSAEGHERFESSGLASVLKNVATNKKPNILCNKYDTDSADNIYVHTKDKVIGYNQDKTLWVYDSTAGTDADAFKLAMDGVMLNYELAEPIVLPTINFE